MGAALNMNTNNIRQVHMHLADIVMRSSRYNRGMPWGKYFFHARIVCFGVVDI